MPLVAAVIVQETADAPEYQEVLKLAEQGKPTQAAKMLDQYLTSVRELEGRLVMQQKWAKLPKPTVDQKPPTDIEDRADFVGRMELMYDLIFLALRTDSTRLVTFSGAGGNYVPTLDGVDEDWHNLSHHGKDPSKIEQLSLIELTEMRLFAKFLQLVL